MIKSVAVALSLTFGLTGQPPALVGCPGLLSVCLPGVSITVPSLPPLLPQPIEIGVNPPAVPAPIPVPSPELPAPPVPVPPAPVQPPAPLPAAPQIVVPPLPQPPVVVPAPENEAPQPSTVAPREPLPTLTVEPEPTPTPTPSITPAPEPTRTGVKPPPPEPAYAVEQVAMQSPDLALLLAVLLVFLADYVHLRYTNRKVMKAVQERTEGL